MHEIVANSDNKNPLVTAGLSVISGVSTWLFQYVQTLEGLGRLVATLAGAGSAVLFFLITLQRWREIRAAREMRAARRRLRLTMPPGDDIPYD